MNILVISEEVRSRPREGLQIFLFHLLNHLETMGEVFVAYSYGECPERVRSSRIVSRKTLMTPTLVSWLKGERFDISFYVPSSGITAFGLLRGCIVKSLSHCPTFLVALQEREIGTLHRLASLLSCPDCILTPHRKIIDRLKKLGLEASFVMPGYDESMFHPVDEKRKMELRRKLKLPTDKFILLHVGHVRSSRNIETFLNYRKWGDDILPVVKGGEVERSWVKRLRMAGVVVIDEYMEKVNELYQAADCYFFPVTSVTGAIEFPLSVIEAAACNLPIISTRFGALEEFFEEKDGFYFYDSPSEIADKISLVRDSLPEINTQLQVAGYTWKSVFNRYLDPLLETLCRSAEDEQKK